MEKLTLAELAVALLPKFTASLMCFLRDRKVTRKLADGAISAAHR